MLCMIHNLLKVARSEAIKKKGYTSVTGRGFLCSFDRGKKVTLVLIKEQKTESRGKDPVEHQRQNTEHHLLGLGFDDRSHWWW